MYKENQELVLQLLQRVLQSNSPFDCGKDKDAPHATFHQKPPLSPIDWEERIPAWHSRRSVSLILQKFGATSKNSEIFHQIFEEYDLDAITGRVLQTGANTVSPELNFFHQSYFFTLLRSVRPKQDPRKIIYILIEVAFSMEIFFFFFFAKYIFTNINIYSFVGIFIVFFLW